MAIDPVLRAKTSDPRAWQQHRAEAMRDPTQASPWLTMSRAAQQGRNIAGANQLGAQSAWGGMRPNNEAAMSAGLQQNIGNYGQMFGGQSTADLGLMRGAEDQRKRALMGSADAWNQSQAGSEFNAQQAAKQAQLANEKAMADYQRKAKTTSANMLAEQYKMQGK